MSKTSKHKIFLIKKSVTITLQDMLQGLPNSYMAGLYNNNDNTQYFLHICFGPNAVILNLITQQT